MADRYQCLQLSDQEPIIYSSTKIEQRKYPRYKMSKDVLSISEDVMAEVVDISGSGISFKFPAIVGKRMNKIENILLLNCQLGIAVEELTCRMIRSSNYIISKTLPAKMIMNCSLEFQNLSKIKRKQLFQFIEECSEDNNVLQNAMTVEKIVS
ncbi:MAG: PilZ domain-containing protein [Pseudomonadota bacterium]